MISDLSVQENGLGGVGLSGIQMVLQMSDSAFPTGGFAHSGGLEAMVQAGRVRGAHDLEWYCRLQLEQVCTGALPFVRDVWREPSRVRELDDLWDAMLTNSVANRASRAQGGAMRLAVERVFGIALPKGGAAHLAPVSGWVFRELGIGLREAQEVFVYQSIRACVSAGIRLGVSGPLEGQAIQWRVLSVAGTFIEQHGGLRSEEAYQSAPLVDVFQGMQDRLYSRLFQT
ncbi:MAG: hypothetical protein RLZZ399_284 [Verrucomicrobiota bacterium]|jgi:urease accessory protein